jgi:hypothetical protein
MKIMKLDLNHAHRVHLPGERAISPSRIFVPEGYLEIQLENSRWILAPATPQAIELAERKRRKW